MVPFSAITQDFSWENPSGAVTLGVRVTARPTATDIGVVGQVLLSGSATVTFCVTLSWTPTESVTT